MKSLNHTKNAKLIFDLFPQSVNILLITLNSISKPLINSAYGKENMLRYCFP